MKIAAMLAGLLVSVAALFLFAASVNPLNGRAFERKSLRRAIERLKQMLTGH